MIMKKLPLGPTLAVIAVLLLGAIFVYFYMSLNRLDKQLLATRDTIVSDSSKISAIVNFFNANANVQTNAK